MNDHIGTDAREDEEIRMLLREAEFTTRTMDPDHLVGVAKRKRRRNLAAMAASSVVIAAVAVGGATALAGSGSGQGELPAAQQPGAAPVQAKAPADRIGTIPAGRRVKVAEDFWFETQGTRWRTSQLDAQGQLTSSGWRGTVGNRNIGDGRSPGLHSSGSGRPMHVVVRSVFRVDNVDRVRYRVEGRWLDAKVYRLAGIPGWVLSVAEYQARNNLAMAEAVYVYDATGKVIADLTSPGR